ncbi:MAG: ribosome-binding factor A [Elusimicrobiales bacterium]|jgi:ribosome-binding factor A|nr:ribosome-binding factor A [Elusimicrobiales bacterium]NLH38974.1 ribosome-binding factor A [Elusimicrobiota bacterium]
MNWRNERLKSTFFNEISSIVSKREELKEIVFFTLTDVDVADEGKTLYVYVSIFEENESDKDLKTKKLFQRLGELSREFKSELRSRIRTKFVPEIVFKMDTTPERASRIEDIFKKIETENNDEKP